MQVISGYFLGFLVTVKPPYRSGTFYVYVRNELLPGLSYKYFEFSGTAGILILTNSLVL